MDNQQNIPDALLERIFARIGQVLTEEDVQKIESLRHTEGNELREFLLAKVPNFDAIAKEEAQAYQNHEEQKTQSTN
jgi:hypothetical protein